MDASFSRGRPPARLPSPSLPNPIPSPNPAAAPRLHRRRAPSLARVAILTPYSAIPITLTTNHVRISRGSRIDRVCGVWRPRRPYVVWIRTLLHIAQPRLRSIRTNAVAYPTSALPLLRTPFPQQSRRSRRRILWQCTGRCKHVASPRDLSPLHFNKTTTALEEENGADKRGPVIRFDQGQDQVHEWIMGLLFPFLSSLQSFAATGFFISEDATTTNEADLGFRCKGFLCLQLNVLHL